ncbi:MAG: SHOCT-like domain-containing protein [bacterium]
MEILWIILAILSLGGALFFLPFTLGAGFFWMITGILLILLVALLVKLIIFLAPIFFVLGVVLIIWGLIESPHKRMRLEERIEVLLDKLLGRNRYYEGERLKILEMLERGEITYEEAMERIKNIRRR